MANCSSSGNQFSFFEGLKSVLGAKRCNQCSIKFEQAKNYWIGIIEQKFNQGGVPATLEQDILRNFQEIQIPPDIGQLVIDRFRYLHSLSEIRWGNVPRISTNAHLDPDEYAHFAMSATYHKPTKPVKLVPGRLLGTNKKLYFFSDTSVDNVTIDWNNVRLVEDTIIVENMTRRIFVVSGTTIGNQTITQPYQTRERGIRLTVSKGAGGVAYVVKDPFYTKIFIDTLIRLRKRHSIE